MSYMQHYLTKGSEEVEPGEAAPASLEASTHPETASVPPEPTTPMDTSSHRDNEDLPYSPSAPLYAEDYEKQVYSQNRTRLLCPNCGSEGKWQSKGPISNASASGICYLSA